MINYYWISIKGKNQYNFLKALFKEKIGIENVIYNQDEILIKTSYREYKRIVGIRTSCNITILKISGTKRIEQLYQKYKISLFVFVISVLFIIFISNLVLFINIETDSKSIKSNIERELINNNISLFSYKKNNKTLKEIALRIKNNNLDQIEWIEIEKKGVYLNIKTISRVNKKIPKNNNFRDIVAEKDGYIRKIESDKGQVLKSIDDYVKKGEVIISGNILKNDKVVGMTRANGKVYAEVWYILKLNENMYYQKQYESSKGNASIILDINNKKIKLLSIHKRINKNKNQILFKNKNFTLMYTHSKSFILKREKYNQTELENILQIKARNIILKNLNDDEYIILQKTLKKYTKNDKMYIEVFFKCYEDIATQQKLKKIEEKKDGK